MRTSPARIVGLLLFTTFSAAAAKASAAAPTFTQVMEADLTDALREMETRDSRPLSFEVNPMLGVVAGAASGNVEYVPVRHVGLLASPRASFVMAAWATEIGARYWTSHRREASGFFVGPSAVYGRTRGEALYGLALDCGVQTIFDSGLTLGAGVGVQYLQGTVGNAALEVGPLESDAKVSRAVLPRLLFSVGYSL